MKFLVIFSFIFISIVSCKTKNINSNTTSKTVLNDTVRIANEKLEYEVIIIDPRFSMWLNSISFPRGYHSESFLENKNYFYITEWNQRVLDPQRFNPNLYEMQINYDANIHYGYEVNYLIYNYMIFFQNTYNQRLFGFVPPR